MPLTSAAWTRAPATERTSVRGEPEPQQPARRQWKRLLVARVGADPERPGAGRSRWRAQRRGDEEGTGYAKQNREREDRGHPTAKGESALSRGARDLRLGGPFRAHVRTSMIQTSAEATAALDLAPPEQRPSCSAA